MKMSAAAAALVCAASLSVGAHARDTIRIVGSSTVFPFSTAVAEQYGSRPGRSTPVVEQTGTGGGIELFCAGVGTGHPDIVNASRRMKVTEFDACVENGVTDIVEVQIGFDGIVLANVKNDAAAPEFNVTLRQVFEALAADLPRSDDDCTLEPNPNETWSDVDPLLPPLAIEVFGPPPTSGTRDAFVEIAMESGARTYTCLNALRQTDSDTFKSIAHKVREDGRWIDSGENDNAMVNSIIKAPSALGVFGFSFLDQNSDRVRGARVDGALPTFENIAAGEYPVSRSMYFYMKKQHIEAVPGLQDFAREFTSDAAWGAFGYLADKGLIPMADERRDEVAARVESLTVMVRDDLAPPAPVDSAPAADASADETSDE